MVSCAQNKLACDKGVYFTLPAVLISIYPDAVPSGVLLACPQTTNHKCPHSTWLTMEDWKAYAVGRMRRVYFGSQPRVFFLPDLCSSNI